MKAVYKLDNWMHTALTQCFQTSKQMSEDTTDLYYYLLGLVLPLIFFEVDALCGDPMRRNGILKSSESLKVQCSTCWSTMPSKCLCIQGPFLLVKKQGTFSQPLASKIWTSKEQLTLRVKMRRSFSCSSFALAKLSHPDMNNSSSAFLATSMSHVLPLGAFSFNPLVICSFRLLTNFLGML